MTSKKSLHVSKKTKTGWRKVDIKDVEDFLEEKRQEERIGTVSEKKDAELFIVDNALSRTARQCLTGKQKRKLNAKRPLRSIQAIENTSKVQDPIVKRNHVKQKKNGRIIEDEVRNPTKPRHFQANKDRAIYHQKLAEKKKGLDFGKDIWEEKDFRDEIPGLKDEKGWVSHKLSLHVAKNIGKNVIKAHDSLRHRTTKAKNIDLPHEGMSYNPSLEAHRDLIEKVVEKEKKIIKTEDHLKRVTTDMFMKVTPEEREQRRLKELSGDVDENDPEKAKDEGNDESNDSPIALNAPVQNKKKTTQVRNKQERHKELLRKHEKQKELKKKLADLMRLKSLKAEVVAEEAKLNELKKHRKKTALKKKFEPKRLSKVKYSEPDIDANMAEDIAGNLRNVKTESNLLIDRFKSLQKRNLLPASVAAPKQKQKKIKRFPRSSHKEELQLQIQ